MLVVLAFAVCPVVAFSAADDPTAALARGQALLAAERKLGLWIEPALHARRRHVGPDVEQHHDVHEAGNAQHPT